MKAITNLAYSDKSERNILDIYLPEKEEFKVLIYFHGGGLENGDKTNMKQIAEELASKGISVVTPNYRLYPSAVFPQFIEDAAEAVAYVIKNMEKYGNAEGFYVGGSSAGAYLAAMLAYDTSYSALHGIKANDISGYIINSAQMTTHLNVLRERGLDTRRIIVDEAAPIYHICEKTDFPNVLILAADNDMKCRYEQNQMFIQTLEHFGCPKDNYKFILMENSRHCSYDNTDKFNDIISNFIEE